MDIIPGIFDDSSFIRAPKDKAEAVIKAFVPLLTAGTAAYITKYMKSPKADASVVAMFKSVMGTELDSYAYMATLRNQKINEKVAAYNLYEVPFHYRKGEFCGFPIDEGLKVVKDLIDHKGVIKSMDNVGTSEAWNNFFDAVKPAFDMEAIQRLLINRDHIYQNRAKPQSTYLSSIVSKMEQLEMGYFGVLYMQHAGREGILIEGSTMF